NQGGRDFHALSLRRRRLFREKRPRRREAPVVLMCYGPEPQRRRPDCRAYGYIQLISLLGSSKSRAVAPADVTRRVPTSRLEYIIAMDRHRCGSVRRMLPYTMVDGINFCFPRGFKRRRATPQICCANSVPNSAEIHRTIPWLSFEFGLIRRRGYSAGKNDRI